VILSKEVPGRLFVTPGVHSESLGRLIEADVADFVPAASERWEY
jgi:hypothetical protein